MARMRVLITVKTYPLPSRSYDELVCTAGILEDGSWVRIYPVPFKFLHWDKYQWIELDLVPHRTQDFRPESHRPVSHDLSEVEFVKKLGTAKHWLERKLALKQTHTYTSMTSLIAASAKPRNVSLAKFQPAGIRKFIVEPDEREWKAEWLIALKQMDMMAADNDPSTPRVPIDKIPYKFKYEFEDRDGRISTMAIEDWEIGALYRNCLHRADGDEDLALDKVRQRYDDEFRAKKDITLFLGTTLEHHRRRHTNPFTIIGVFYPPRQPQRPLF